MVALTGPAGGLWRELTADALFYLDVPPRLTPGSPPPGPRPAGPRGLELAMRGFTWLAELSDITKCLLTGAWASRRMMDLQSLLLI